ncbi:hypothetical protein [Siphonobacter sp. BAB-5405]|uniref:hypothetical protein n=2 Tax=Siphonobacter sp. BAB-5405 TaxID=1864825 RepID=UPI0011AF43B8|nr:hypothetical protein [Siphonobacter sp. BAB-5405]
MRLWRNQFRVGDKWIVRLNEKEIKLVQVLTVKPVRLHELDSTITLLDAGLMPERFRELMLEIYEDHVPSVDDALFVLVALSTIETYAVAPAQ